MLADLCPGELLNVPWSIPEAGNVLAAGDVQDPPDWLPRDADKEMRPAYPLDLSERLVGAFQVLQDLACDDQVEGILGEWQVISRSGAEGPVGITGPRLGDLFAADVGPYVAEIAGEGGGAEEMGR